MLLKTVLPALALSALVLSGCGGGAPATAPSAAAPADSAPASAAAPSATEAVPSTSPSTAAAEVKDPCTLLSASDIADVTGVDVKKGTTSAVGTSKLCSWLPEDASKSDAAVFSAQEGPLPGPLSAVEDQLKTEFGGKVSKLTVPGADDARYVTGKKSGLNVIDVLAQKDEVFYQVLVASPRDVGQHKASTIKLTQTLLKG